MGTLANSGRSVSSGVTQTRCQKCKKFARLLPGDTECAACAGHLDLPITPAGKAGGR
jgi:hypothetical protein